MPRRTQNPPLLTLTMIVRDEEAHLERCLASVAACVDEIVVCDTGSRDRTVSIAESFGARVVHFDWCDDFAAARNHVLGQATGQWVLSLDADEVLVPTSGPLIREIISHPPDERARAYQVLVRHYHDPRDDSDRTEQYFARLFTRHPSVRWVGPIHEHLTATPELELSLAPEIVIEHFGHTREARRQADKEERNVRLLQRAIEAYPSDPYYPFKLGQHYLDAGQWQQARALGEQALALCSRPGSEDWLAQIYTLVASACLKGGRPAEAASAGERGLQRFPDHAGLWYQLGTIRLLQGEHAQAEECYRRAMKLRGTEARQGLTPGMTSWLPLHGLAGLQELHGDYPAAYELYEEARQHAPRNGDVTMSSARMLLALGRPGEAELLLRGFLESREQAGGEADDWDGQALTLLADSLVEQGNGHEAEEMLRQALLAHPGLDRARLRLGWLLCDGAEYAAALGVLAPFVDDPAAPAAAYDCLARALWGLDRVADATNATAIAADKRGKLAAWRAGFDRSQPPKAFPPFEPPARPLRIGILFRSGGVAFTENMLGRKPLGGTETAVLRMMGAMRTIGHEVYLEQYPERLQWLQGVDVLLLKRHPLVLEPPLATLTYFWTGDDVDQPFWDRLRETVYREQFLRLVTRCFALSGYMAERMMELGIPEHKIFITKNGFDPTLFDGLPPVEEDCRPPRCVYTSSASRGLRILLDVWPEIRRQVPDAELQVFSSSRLYGQVAGEKPQDLALYERARSMAGVHYIGSVPQPELARALRGARLLLYPNTFPETSCIAAIEAQAAGCGVVTSALGALPETASGNALIREPLGSDAYAARFVAEAVDLLRDDGRWRQLSRQNRERMCAYTWAAVAQQWLTMIASDLAAVPAGV